MRIWYGIPSKRWLRSEMRVSTPRLLLMRFYNVGFSTTRYGDLLANLFSSTSTDRLSRSCQADICRFHIKWIECFQGSRALHCRPERSNSRPNRGGVSVCDWRGKQRLYRLYWTTWRPPTGKRWAAENISWCQIRERKQPEEIETRASRDCSKDCVMLSLDANL